MSSAFVTGASGYIGHHVAVALRAAGYRVYGLVRSQEKGNVTYYFVLCLGSYS